MGKVKGDFGGVSYAKGDFVTNGTSGIGNMGLSLNDVFSTVFGQQGAEAVKTTLQSGATAVTTNIVGSKLASDPNAKKSIVETAKETIATIYQEYKVPVIIVGGTLSALAILGVYNTFKKKA